MKATVYTKYGSPDVLHLQDVAKPTPKAEDVLVKIQAASINFGDKALVKQESQLTSSQTEPERHGFYEGTA